MIIKGYTESVVKYSNTSVPAYLINAPEFWKTAKTWSLLIREGPLLVKKFRSHGAEVAQL